MNILYTLNSGNMGGMEKHTASLVKSMVDSGNNIFVWCPVGINNEIYKKFGAHITNEKIRFDIDPIYIFKLTKFIKKHNIEIIHSHELKAVTNSLFASLISRLKVRVTHSHTPISEWKISALKRQLNMFIYSNLVNILSSREIALTESRKSIKVLEGIDPRKISIIPNCVDTTNFNISIETKNQFRKNILEKYKIDSDSFVFGFVSRISEEKGHNVLIEAFSKLITFTPESKEKIVLLIAGGGTLQSEIEQKIRELHLENKVFVTGVFPEDELIKYYSALDAFVFPTLAEGFGIVLIEAMASRLPCICSDLDVLQEVGGSCVMYFETGNPDALSRKMHDLYLRKDSIQNLGQPSYERVVELFSVEKFTKSYLDLYTKLLEENK